MHEERLLNRFVKQNYMQFDVHIFKITDFTFHPPNRIMLFSYLFSPLGKLAEGLSILLALISSFF